MLLQANSVLPGQSTIKKFLPWTLHSAQAAASHRSLHRQQATCSSAQLGLMWSRAVYLPALPEVGRAPGQGPDAECLAAAGAKDRRGGGQLHCAIRFEQALSRPPPRRRLGLLQAHTGCTQKIYAMYMRKDNNAGCHIAICGRDHQGGKQPRLPPPLSVDFACSIWDLVCSCNA